MLVLSRKINQAIVINHGEIVITVADIRGDKVRLGIQADPSISIHREEIQDIIDRERRPGPDDMPEGHPV